MSETVELALIRHGLPNRFEGVVKPDPGLTEDGFEQARAVADAMILLPVRRWKLRTYNELHHIEPVGSVPGGSQ